jgi:hypothetical protein
MAAERTCGPKESVISKDSPNMIKTRNIFMLTCKFPGKLLPRLEETDITHAAT